MPLRRRPAIGTILEMDTPNKIPLILCFGDSLTAGYQTPSRDNPSGRETPYGRFLEELLGGRARIAVSGVCGEVTGEMVLRFRSDVLQRRPDYVVILGGTNDLGWNASPHEIIRNLVKRLRDAARGKDNLMPAVLESVRAYATLGEICGALRQTWGEYVPPTAV